MEFCVVFLVGYLMLSCFVATCHGVTFSALNRTLIVSVKTQHGHVLDAGEDYMIIQYEFNQTFPQDTNSTYKTLKLKLCFDPESQFDRPWRKTVDDLNKDKTCQHMIGIVPYNPSMKSYVWIVDRDIPSADYFVRVYALDGQDVVVGYGQNTDDYMVVDIFTINAITGCHGSIDVASICFTVFSICSLMIFFYIERIKGENLQHK